MGSDKERMRIYMARRYRQNRRFALKILGGKCARCGSSVGLEIDHVDPGSKVRSSRWMLNLGMSRLVAELKKCQLLCGKHHDEKTVLERGQALARGKHGTISTYRYCKCSLCRQAKSDHYKRYRKRVRNSNRQSA